MLALMRKYGKYVSAEFRRCDASASSSSLYRPIHISIPMHLESEKICHGATAAAGLGEKSGGINAISTEIF